MPSGIQYLETLGVRVFMESSNFVTGAAKVKQETLSLEQQILKTSAKLTALQAVTNPTAGQTRQIARLTDQLEKLKQQAIAVKASMYALGTAAIGIPLLTISTLAVKNFATLDDAIHKTMATMADYQLKYKDVLMTSSLQLSTGTPTKAVGIAGAFEEFAHTGHSFAEAHVMMDTAQKASVVSGMNVVDVVRTLTAAQRNLGMEFENSEDKIRNFVQLADMVTKGSQMAATSWDVFAKGLADPKLGSAVRGMGMDPNDVGALVLAYAEMGFNSKNSSRSGIGIANLYREISKSASLPQFSKVWQAAGMNPLDQYGNIKKPSDLILTLAERLNGLSDSSRKVITDGIGFTRMSDNFVAALMNIDGKGMSAAGMIKFFTEGLHEANGALENSYQVRMKAFNKQMEVLWNNISNVATIFGGTLAPVLEKVGQGLNYLLEGFMQLNPFYQKMIVISTLAVSFSMLAVSIALLVNQLKQLVIVKTLLSVVTGTFGTVFKTVWSGISTALFFRIPFWSGLARGIAWVGTSIAGLFTGTLTLGGIIASIGAGLSAMLAGFMAILPIVLAVAAAIAVIYALYKTGTLNEIWEGTKNGFGGLAGIMYNYSENWKILMDFMGDSWSSTLKRMFQELSYFFLNIVASALVSVKIMAEDAYFKLRTAKVTYNGVGGFKVTTPPEDLWYDKNLDTYYGTVNGQRRAFDPTSELKYAYENDPANSMQRKLDLEAQKRMETPFKGMNVIGLPKFNTALPKAEDWSKLTDNMFPFKDAGGAGGPMPDMGMSTRPHEFVEMPQARFMIGGEASIDDGFTRIDKRLQELIQAVKESRLPQKPEDAGHPGKTPHSPNPAHVPNAQRFPIKNHN